MKKCMLMIVGLAILLCRQTVIRADSNELGDIKQQLSDLEKRTATLEEEQKAETNPTDFRAYWKEGLNFDSQDGSFKLKIGGWLNNITAGLNWYLNPKAKIMCDYVRSDKNTVGRRIC